MWRYDPNRLPTYYKQNDLIGVDFRAHPEKYRVGKGEQGVLMVEPYKSEILPNRRFKDPETATESSSLIYAQFLDYVDQQDFVGADMARKFIQMGFTRARRYANHKGGKKYSQNPQDEPTAEAEKKARKKYLIPRLEQPDPIKAEAARIFKEARDIVEHNERYAQAKRDWKEQYG